MIRFTAPTPEVFVADQPFVHFGRADIEYLKERAAGNARKRIRFCAHKDPQDPLHEMLLVFAKGTYVWPSEHLGKQESLHVLEGRGEYVFFDRGGGVKTSIPLGDEASGRRFYLRTPEDIYHGLHVESDVFVIHEVTQGPFRKADTVYASWAPPDGDPRVSSYMDGVLAKARGLRAAVPIKISKETAGLWVADEAIVHLGRPELEELFNLAAAEPSGRAELRTHRDAGRKLQERFVVVLKGRDEKPRPPAGLDLSFHVVSGEADLLLSDAAGKTIETIPLGPAASGRQFYARVPGNAGHALRPRTDRLSLHQTTTAPSHA